MVDGMGPTGTEGTFARAAEATTRVLRDNSNALLTILSAIASDPLYRFTGKKVRLLASADRLLVSFSVLKVTAGNDAIQRWGSNWWQQILNFLTVCLFLLTPQ